MMGRATRPVVPPNRNIKLDRVYAQPWGPLYPRERKSFGEPQVRKVPLAEIQPVHVLAAIDMCQSYIGLFGAV
jgi:hypothetical protein